MKVHYLNTESVLAEIIEIKRIAAIQNKGINYIEVSQKEWEVIWDLSESVFFPEGVRVYGIEIRQE